MERWRKWKNDPLLLFPKKMMANLEMLTSLSNTKRLLTEVAVTKYVCWKWYSPNNTIPKSSNMISLYLYLMLIKFCNNCIGKGVAHQVYPPHPHPWAIPSPTHFFWQAACRHTMWKSEKMSIHDFEKKTSWAKCIGILNKVSQLDTNSALWSSVVFFVMLFWYFCRLHWLEGE